MRASLRRRLLIQTSAIVFLTAAAVAGFVWWQMNRSLRQGLDALLRTEAAALASRVEADEGRIEFEYEPGSLRHESAENRPLVQIITPSNQSIFSSREIPQASDLPGQVMRHAAAASIAVFDTHLVTGRPSYRVFATLVDPVVEDGDPAGRAPAVQQKVWVIVARPLAPILGTLRQLAWTLASAVLAATVLAVVAGYYVSRRGTQPIVSLANHLATIDAEHPELNIDARRMPVELDPIVTTTEALLRRIDSELTRQRRLTADLAHDLRTPLAGVRALLDVCLQRPRENSEYKETISVALESLRRFTGMLENVLVLARLDAGSEVLRMTSVAVDELVSESVATLRPLALSRGIRIEIEGASGMAIMADRDKLQKVLTNVLANAIEYSPAAARVSVQTRSLNERLEIHVADQGAGITPDNRERVFERFFRADASRAEGAGHNGLGLPIARGLMRLMGGDLNMRENQPRGSDFVLVLPKREGAAV